MRGSDASSGVCAAVGAPPAGVRLLVAGFLVRTAASAMALPLAMRNRGTSLTVGLPQRVPKWVAELYKPAAARRCGWLSDVDGPDHDGGEHGRKERRMELTLIPWSEDDLRVLERANSTDMTRFLGGVESDEDLAARHALYSASPRRGAADVPRRGGRPSPRGTRAGGTKCTRGCPSSRSAARWARSGRAVGWRPRRSRASRARPGERAEARRRVRRGGQRRLERAVPAPGLRAPRHRHLPPGRGRFRREHLGDRPEASTWT